MKRRFLSLFLSVVMLLNAIFIPAAAQEARGVLPEGMGSNTVAESEPNDFTGSPNTFHYGQTITGSLWFSMSYGITDLLDCFTFTVSETNTIRIYAVTEYGEEDLSSPFKLELKQSGTTIASDTVSSYSKMYSYPYLYTLEEKLSPGTYTIHLSGTYFSSNDYMLYLDVCRHPNASTVVINPTCTTGGYTNYICPDCHTTTQGDFTDALGHDEAVVEEQPSTCVEAGHTKGTTCSRCGEILSGLESLPLTEHIWGGWRVETPANCAEDGAKTRTCFICKEKETQIIPATGVHTFSDWTLDKEPTCGEDGANIRTCSGCEKTEIEPIPATGIHSFGDWSIDKEPTCVEDGTNIRTCSGCGETETESIPKTGVHQYEATQLELVKAPDCHRTGLLSGKKCVVCQDAVGEVLPKLTGYDYTVPSGVVRIGDGAFKDLDQTIKSVTLPDSVTRIGKEAFYNCRGLTSVNFGQGLVSIGDNAFYGTGLKGITFPDSLTTIGYEAFASNRYLTEMAFGKGLISIGTSAFTLCDRLTGLTLPEGLLSIGTGAFSSCSCLVHVTLPESLTKIGQYAFSGCFGLTRINIPSKVSKLEPMAFSQCVALEEIRFGNGPIQISYHAFENCARLSSITFGDGDTQIEGSAFYSCSNLEEITFGDGKVILENEAFVDCKKISRIIFGNGETIIGDYNHSNGFGIFLHCSGLTEVTFGDGPTTIGRAAFQSSNLVNVTFGDGALKIGEGAFLSCGKLTTVTFGDGPTTIGPKAFSSTGLTEMTFGHGETTIGGLAFANCPDLAKVTFPDNVQSIGGSVFQDSGVKLVYFLGCPSNMSSAFSGTTATGFHPTNDSRWTESKKKLAGGNITWYACNHEFEGSSCESLESCYSCGATWYGHSYVDATCTSPRECTDCNRNFGKILEHSFSEGVCQSCGSYRPGDLNQDGEITQSDAEYLIWHTFFREVYPLKTDADFNCDGTVTAADAIKLLWYALYPENNPL